MSRRLTAYLEEIYRFLVQWNMPVTNQFNEGLEKSYIHRKFSQLNLEIVEELVELYSWRNGIDVEEGMYLDDVQFIPGFHIMSLESAIKQYEAIHEDGRWNANWFPVMANGGGDFYAVELSSNDSKHSIVGFILGETDHEVEYRNLTSMMQTIYQCYLNGIIFQSESGWLEMDDAEFSRIARECNVGIKYWDE